MAKPICVLISDVHYNISTLPQADAAMNAAIKCGEDNQIPVIVAGDLHDTKANLRGECISAMIKTFRNRKTKVVVMTGNHCMINEKSKEHSLEFLRPYIHHIADHTYEPDDLDLDLTLIPYQTSSEDLEDILGSEPPGRTLIMHQGVMGAFMGHYTQDKTSLPKEAFKDFRVISGHYHRHQHIKCGRPRRGGVGLFSYVGNPYTLNFGEAHDGPKGYCILMDDGSLEQVELDLRRHLIIEDTVDQFFKSARTIRPQDLVWVKLHGTQSQLDGVDRKAIAGILGRDNFKLDLLPTEQDQTVEIKVENMTDGELLDAHIDAMEETPEQKLYLKSLWKELL